MRRKIDSGYLAKLIGAGLVLQRAQTASSYDLRPGTVTNGQLLPSFAGRLARTESEAIALFNEDLMNQWVAVDLIESHLIAIVGEPRGAGWDRNAPTFKSPLRCQLFKARSARVCEWGHQHDELLRVVGSTALEGPSMIGSWVIGETANITITQPSTKLPRTVVSKVLLPLNEADWMQPVWKVAPGDMPASWVQSIEASRYNESSANFAHLYRAREIVPTPPSLPRRPLAADYLDGPQLRRSGPKSADLMRWVAELLEHPEEVDAELLKTVAAEAKKAGVDGQLIADAMTAFIDALASYRTRLDDWYDQWSWIDSRPVADGLAEKARQAEAERLAAGGYRQSWR